MLKLCGISYTYNHTPVLHQVSAQFEAGKVHVLIGPNGSGKSTLIKIAAGELWPGKGQVYYGLQQITKKDIPTLATYRAVLAQNPELYFPLTVKEIVQMGRYPHYKNFPGGADDQIVEAAMDQMQLHEFGQRNYLTLSGGEKQRVHFARVLAQLWHKNSNGMRYFFLDEPLSFLDLNYQHEFMKKATAMAQSGDVVVAVLHDINLAALYADKVFVLFKGHLLAEGPPHVVITSDLMFKLYGVAFNVHKTGIKEPSIFIPG